VRFIRKELLQGSQQKRPKFTLLLIHSVQGLVLKEVKEKALGQVLRVVRREPICRLTTSLASFILCTPVHRGAVLVRVS
jgi:hypothetical protein